MSLIERQAAIDAINELIVAELEKRQKPSKAYWAFVAAKMKMRCVPSAQPETHEERTETLACDLISRQAAIDALKEHKALFCDNTPDTFAKLSYGEKCRVDELDGAIATLINLPSAPPETCEGCKHLGKWENEVEYGYPSPCTRCKRRVNDNYEQ